MFMSLFFFFKQKTAYEITYGDWSSDVCSSDLRGPDRLAADERDGAWQCFRGIASGVLDHRELRGRAVEHVDLPLEDDAEHRRAVGADLVGNDHERASRQELHPLLDG